MADIDEKELPATVEVNLGDENDQLPKTFGDMTLEMTESESFSEKEPKLAQPARAEGLSQSLDTSAEPQVDLGVGSGVEGSSTMPSVAFSGPGLQRDRPFSASMISRKSTMSTKSQTTLSGSIVVSDYSASKVFAYREGKFDNALVKCKEAMYKADLDGEFNSAWLLTQIDHWDCERERIVLLTEFSMFVVHYDFVNDRIINWSRIFLDRISVVQFGDIVYPAKSLMPRRDHGGVRIYWGSADIGVFQKWNPWASDLPFVTFCHHQILYNQKECETATFNVDEFCDSLRELVPKAQAAKSSATQVEIKEEPVMIETYASLTSMVFNQSYLGFNRDRNGLNF